MAYFSGLLLPIALGLLVPAAWPILLINAVVFVIVAVAMLFVESDFVHHDARPGLFVVAVQLAITFGVGGLIGLVIS